MLGKRSRANGSKDLCSQLACAGCFIAFFNPSRCVQLFSRNGEGIQSFRFFATGTWMHKVPLSARGIEPISVEPAVLLDYAQVFQAFSKYGEAYATLKNSKGDSSYGILLELPLQFLSKLDEIQQGYERQSGLAQMENGTQHACILYAWKSNHCEAAARPLGTELPSRRYLDTMVQGLESFGGNHAAVQALQNLPSIPRKLASDYVLIPAPPAGTTLSYLDLQSMNGENGKALMGCVNGKVVEFIGDPESPSRARFRRVVRDYPKELDVKDAALAIAAIAFDPIFGKAPPRSLAAMTQAHRQYVEDFFMERFGSMIKVRASILEKDMT